MIEKKKNIREKLLWQIGKQGFSCEVLPSACVFCGKIGVLVGLPKPLLDKQTDDTNVVCHPAIGGCNHGFHMKLKSGQKLYRLLVEGRA